MTFRVSLNHGSTRTVPHPLYETDDIIPHIAVMTYRPLSVRC